MILIVLGSSAPVFAQSKKQAKAKKTDTSYPQSFFILKSELQDLFTLKAGQLVTLAGNKYINKSSVLMNTKNGDISFLRIKLSYFKNAYLLVQVNGGYSTQYFVMSDDKSVFYKGKPVDEKIIMTRCTEDEIVSE